jgi:hypothetical protein
MMGHCKKCGTHCAIIFLVLGVLFLLRDLNVWDFWGISWWTALLIVMGGGALLGRNCPDCNEKKK